MRFIKVLMIAGLVFGGCAMEGASTEDIMAVESALTLSSAPDGDDAQEIPVEGMDGCFQLVECATGYMASCQMQAQPNGHEVRCCTCVRMPPSLFPVGSDATAAQ